MDSNMINYFNLISYLFKAITMANKNSTFLFSLSHRRISLPASALISSLLRNHVHYTGKNNKCRGLHNCRVQALTPR